jgi:hypothetical protein
MPSGEIVSARIKLEVLQAACRVQMAQRIGELPDPRDVAILVMAEANETDGIVVEHASTDRLDNPPG